MADKHPESITDLLDSLRRLRIDQPKAVRSSTHIYPARLFSKADHDAQAESSSQGAKRERDRHITSWKMTEHMYFQSNNPFPTLARGLFTEEVQEGDPKPEGVRVGGDRIVARGYDKFFNIDEVAWTEWDAMRKFTEPPYYLTLKSNGCLILISALSPTQLVVASKHSLGTTTVEAAAAGEGDAPAKEAENAEQAEAQGEQSEKQDRAHAEVGRQWLKRTLERSGRTEAELAQRLWNDNLTAVLELCDDSFEEHVIATPTYWTGLHLHGLNLNTPHFATLPPTDVSEFAKSFGFIPTKVVELPTLDAVRDFTNDVAKTGSWEGDMIEGFVVRSTVRANPLTDDQISNGNGEGTLEEQSQGKGKPPYRPGAPFFFKVKFDEPYLLYRQWREVTRMMLPLLDPDLPAEKVNAVWEKARKRSTKRSEVALYASWIGEKIKADPALFTDYDRGVVRVREAFLEWTRGDGQGEWQKAQRGEYKLTVRPVTPGNAEDQKKGNAKKEKRTKGKGDPSRALGKGGEKAPTQMESVDRSTLPTKWIVVPMAVPGCGKTMVGLVLSRLFGWGHTQSDDITSKKSAPGFLKNIATLLKSHDVVYADRNNHIDKHYIEISALTKGEGNKQIPEIRALDQYNIHLIGLLWDVESQPYHRVLRLCSERVVSRGDNHQTLRPDPSVQAEHEAVVGKFIRNFTAPNEDLFHTIIDVPLGESPRNVVRRIVSGLSSIKFESLSIANPLPDDQTIEQAIDEAKQYKSNTPYHPIDKTGKLIRYFGLAPEIDVSAVVEIGIYHMSPEFAHSCQRFLSYLQREQRLVRTPHVTLSHENNVKAEEEGVGVAEGDGEGVNTSSAPKNDNTQTKDPGPQRRAWDACKFLVEHGSPLWAYDVTHIVWDGRVMALILADLRLRPDTAVPSNGSSAAGDKKALSKIDESTVILPEVRKYLHITVGTKNEDIRPFESRGIVYVAKGRIALGEDEGMSGEIVSGGGEVRWAKVGRVEGEGRVKGMS